MNKFLKKLKKYFVQDNYKLSLGDLTSFKIGVLHISEVACEDERILAESFSLLGRDHNISNIGNYNPIEIDPLKLVGNDLIVIIGCGSNLSRTFIDLLRKIKKPTIHISTNIKSENVKYLNFFDLVMYKDFGNLNASGNKKIKMHGLPYFEENAEFFEPRYFYSQLRTGINLLKERQTRISNRITSKRNLSVGFNSFHNGNFQVHGNVHSTVDSFCSFGRNVALYTVNHDTRFPTTQGFLYREYFNQEHPGELKVDYSKSRSKGPITIKNDVWIGDDVKIMSGVTIGNGACIAANAVVTKDVKDYEIVAGVPAKHLAYRYSPVIIQNLLDLKWWYWSDSRIRKNSLFFSTDLTNLENLNNKIQ